MQPHAVLLVQGDDYFCDLRPEYPRHRRLVLADDVDLKTASAQARAGLKADEARPQHDDAPRRFGGGDNRFGVGERAQHMHLRPLRAGKLGLARFGACGQKKPVIFQLPAIAQQRNMATKIEACDAGAEFDFDAARVERLGAEAGVGIIPGAFEIVLGQQRALIGRRWILRDERNATIDALAAEHVGRRETGAAAADDQEGFLPRRGALLLQRPRLRLY